MPFARQHREEIKRLASGGGWYGETVSETMKLLPLNHSSWGGSATEQKKNKFENRIFAKSEILNPAGKKSHFQLSIFVLNFISRL